MAVYEVILIKSLLLEYTQTIELCHGKTDLKIFVIVIPKEGLAGANPSFRMTPTTRDNRMKHVSL